MAAPVFPLMKCCKPKLDGDKNDTADTCTLKMSCTSNLLRYNSINRMLIVISIKMLCNLLSSNQYLHLDSGIQTNSLYFILPFYTYCMSLVGESLRINTVIVVHVTKKTFVTCNNTVPHSEMKSKRFTSWINQNQNFNKTPFLIKLHKTRADNR